MKKRRRRYSHSSSSPATSDSLHNHKSRSIGAVAEQGTAITKVGVVNTTERIRDKVHKSMHKHSRQQKSRRNIRKENMYINSSGKVYYDGTEAVINCIVTPIYIYLI